MSVLFAYVHYVSFALALALLVQEWSVLKEVPHKPGLLRRLAVIDGLYGLAVLGSLSSGLLRATMTEKGWDYYLHNGMFHGKLTLFLLAALVSLYPTIYFFRKRKIADDAQLDATDLAALKKIKRCLLIEIHLYAIIPLLASLMARGYGAR